MISVCIATYNGERFIGQQLASILSQLGDGDEVVVSDDGSTDGTLSVVKAFNDSRVRIISGPCKGSLVLNFENALRAATGDFIFLADQDDVWADGKVAVCTERLRRYSCVVTDAVVADGNLNITSPSFMRLNKTKPGKWYNLLVKTDIWDVAWRSGKRCLTRPCRSLRSYRCMTYGLAMSRRSGSV